MDNMTAEQALAAVRDVLKRAYDNSTVVPCVQAGRPALEWSEYDLLLMGDLYPVEEFLNQALTAPRVPADVNYVDAFNGDIPMPAPGESLSDAMTNQAYLESLEQSADRLDECIEMLFSLPSSPDISKAIVKLVSAVASISLAINDEQLQRAVISREHMQDSKREDV